MANDIKLSQVNEACRALGLEPRNVLSVDLTANSVSVTEFVRDPDGNLILQEEGGFQKKTRLIEVAWDYADND